MDSTFSDMLMDQSETVVKSAGLSLSVAIIGVPYIYFNLPGSQMIPQQLCGALNFWLLIGGITMIISLFRNKYRKVKAKCPHCGNALKEVNNPKWNCTVCEWKQS